MLSSALTVHASRTAVVLPGTLGSQVFDQITGPSGQKIVRRVAGTANARPSTLTISHDISGTGFRQRCRTLVRADLQVLTTDIADTGGVVPAAFAYYVLDRPLSSGAAIATTDLGDLTGYVIDVLTVSGQFAKILNQEA